jgi:hypothetical protein
MKKSLNNKEFEKSKYDHKSHRQMRKTSYKAPSYKEQARLSAKDFESNIQNLEQIKSDV